MAMRIEQGDITKLAVDAIVNAANQVMLGGGNRTPCSQPLRGACAHETEVAPDRRTLMLKSHPNGACVYLTDDNRCRIHEVKPDKCRTFPFEWTNTDSHEICPGLGRASGI